MNHENKLVCMLAYTIFFLPLLVDKESVSYRFHSSQGLNLLVFSLCITFFGVIVPVVGWFIIIPLGAASVIVLWVIGLYNAYNEKEKELPVIGKYKLFR